jgi:fermentation-respiration switch protein FrsA (DUF1100 family)
MVCLSYRGYWKSKGRPSERGINQDAEAALRWIADRAKADSGPAAAAPSPPVLVFWGQSVGCGFATNLAASRHFPTALRLDSLVLETPFTNTRDMLAALYPWRWVPYKYLWPFLRTHLDTRRNLGAVAERRGAAGGAPPPRVFILEAGRDELVPAGHGEELERRAGEVGLPVERVAVPLAYHNEAMIRAEGKRAVARAIETHVREAVAQRLKEGLA